MISRKLLIPWLVIGFLALFTSFLTGCRKEQKTVSPTATTEIIIPFETIELAEEPVVTGEYYEGAEPNLVVIMKEEDIDPLGNTISTYVQARLRNLDYNQEIAVVVFQSENIDWIGIEIQRVTLTDNWVTIETNITKRNPEIEFKDTKISPYHVISIPKTGLQEDTTFELSLSYILKEAP